MIDFVPSIYSQWIEEANALNYNITVFPLLCTFQVERVLVHTSEMCIVARFQVVKCLSDLPVWCLVVVFANHTLSRHIGERFLIPHINVLLFQFASNIGPSFKYDSAHFILF